MTRSKHSHKGDVVPETDSAEQRNNSYQLDNIFQKRNDGLSSHQRSIAGSSLSGVDEMAVSYPGFGNKISSQTNSAIRTSAINILSSTRGNEGKDIPRDSYN